MALTQTFNLTNHKFQALIWLASNLPDGRNQLRPFGFAKIGQVKGVKWFFFGSNVNMQCFEFCFTLFIQVHISIYKNPFIILGFLEHFGLFKPFRKKIMFRTKIKTKFGPSYNCFFKLLVFQ